MLWPLIDRHSRGQIHYDPLVVVVTITIVTVRWADSSGCRPPPQGWADPPSVRQTPLALGRPPDTVNKRAVRIFLECILVVRLSVHCLIIQ